MLKGFNDAPPPEVAAINYGLEFVKKLRHKDGWRQNALSLIYEELQGFVRLSTTYEFGLQSLWDYGQLVEVIDQYLQYRQNAVLTKRLYIKVCRDLRGIKVLLGRLPYDEWEKRSMREAFEGILPILKSWRDAKGARE